MEDNTIRIIVNWRLRDPTRTVNLIRNAAVLLTVQSDTEAHYPAKDKQGSPWDSIWCLFIRGKHNNQGFLVSSCEHFEELAL